MVEGEKGRERRYRRERRYKEGRSIWREREGGSLERREVREEGMGGWRGGREKIRGRSLITLVVEVREQREVKGGGREKVRG